MKLIAAFMIVLALLAASAMETTQPPLTAETIAGSWEALMTPRSDMLVPDTLWHMEINEKGESYLAQITADGRDCIVRPLISSKISGGSVSLHFGTATSEELKRV